MKIGFFTDTYLPQLDGVAVSVDACAKALEALGHEVYVIAPRFPGYKDITPNVYRLTSFKYVTTPELRWALQLPEKPLLSILRINFDIIHGHAGAGMTLLGLEIARARNIPFIGTYHTLIPHYSHYFLKGKIVTPKMLEFYSKFFGNVCDYMIAPTERIKKELLEYGVTRPLVVLPTGIDLETYQKGKKNFLRNALQIPHNKKIVLYVGRLGKEKSVDFLIQSFKHIIAEEKDTVFVLVGEGPDKNALQRLVKKLGLEKSVFFMGSIPHAEIQHVYASASVFVFASQTETQGLVLLEALASGVPVVAVDDDTFDAVITSGKNGFLVAKDSKMFAEKVVSLLQNRELHELFVKEGLKHVKKFSIENTAKNLEKLYLQSMKEKGEKTKNYLHVKSINQIKKFLITVNNTLKKFYE